MSARGTLGGQANSLWGAIKCELSRSEAAPLAQMWVTGWVPLRLGQGAAMASIAAQEAASPPGGSANKGAKKGAVRGPGEHLQPAISKPGCKRSPQRNPEARWVQLLQRGLAGVDVAGSLGRPMASSWEPAQPAIWKRSWHTGGPQSGRVDQGHSEERRGQTGTCPLLLSLPPPAVLGQL